MERGKNNEALPLFCFVLTQRVRGGEVAKREPGGKKVLMRRRDEAGRGGAGRDETW